MNQKTQQEGQEIFDQKKKQLGQRNILQILLDLVRWDDMREALKNCMTLEGTIEIG